MLPNLWIFQGGDRKIAKQADWKNVPRQAYLFKALDLLNTYR